MRDVRNFSATHKRVTRIVHNGSVSTINLTRTSIRSQRSDSTSTTSVGGVYVRPTDYDAFFSLTSAVPSSGKWRTHQWPYTGKWWTYDSREDGGQDRNVYRHGCDAVSLRPDIPTSVLSVNREKVWEQIRNNDLNLGQTIGELRESVDTISSLIRDAVSLLRAARGSPGGLGSFSTPRAAKRSLKNRLLRPAASNYLRYMYGIRPIISDIHGIADRVANGLGSGNLSTIRAVTIDGSFGPHTVFPTFPERWFEGEMVRGVETSVTISLTNDVWFQAWRYGLTNPLALAWELTTLSFVADWFLHIGGFLSALGGPLGTKFDHGYETRFLRINGTYKERWSPDPVPNRVVVEREAVSSVPIYTRAMHRERLIGIPVPLPYLDLELNLNQAMNLIALLAAAR